MKRLVAFCFVIISFFCDAQIVGANKVQKKTSIEILSTNAEEGTIYNDTSRGVYVIKTTSGWEQLLTKCYPQPEIPEIDTIYQAGNSIAIVLDNILLGDSIQLESNSKVIDYNFTDTIVFLGFTPDNKNQTVILRVSNNCGSVDSSLLVSVSVPKISKVEDFKIDGVAFKARKVDNLWWMCEGVKKGNVDAYFEINQNSSCPSGWRLPTENEWHNLLMNYEGAFNSLFEAPESGIGLGLTHTGAKKDDELIMHGERAFYWYDEGKKDGVVILTEVGSLFVNEDIKNIKVPIRCVK